MSINIESHGFNPETGVYTPKLDEGFLAKAVETVLGCTNEEDIQLALREAYERGYKTCDAMSYLSELSKDPNRNGKLRAKTLENYLLIRGWDPEHAQWFIKELWEDDQI